MNRAVLFDLYGTLIDIETDERDPALWRELAKWGDARLGISSSPQQLQRAYADLCSEMAAEHGEGFVLRRVFAKLLGGPGEDVVRDFAREFRRLSTRSLRSRSYAVPLLRRLRADGFRLALVSNTEGILTDYDLDRLKLRAYFDSIILSSDVGVAKPDSRILEIALDALDTAPDHVVLVGDSMADFNAAAGLGIPCVLVASHAVPQVSARSGAVITEPVLDELYANITSLFR